MTGAGVRVSGHLGELLQGRLGPEGPVVLVTLPAPGLWLEVMRRDGAFALSPSLAQVLDADRLQALLKLLEVPLTGQFAARVAMPVGAGAGASTAALLAVAQLVAPHLSMPQIEAICHQIEGASDPLLRIGAERILWASRRAEEVGQLPPPPDLLVVGGFVGAAVRTDPQDMNFPDISDLLAAWPDACGDPDAFAALVTRSARRTLALRGGCDPEALQALGQRIGALGFAIAHTGTARAFLFPAAHRPEPTLRGLAALGWSHLQSLRLGGAPIARG